MLSAASISWTVFKNFLVSMVGFLERLVLLKTPRVAYRYNVKCVLLLSLCAAKGWDNGLWGAKPVFSNELVI